MVRDRDGKYFTGKHREFLKVLVFATQVPLPKNENGGLEIQSRITQVIVQPLEFTHHLITF